MTESDWLRYMLPLPRQVSIPGSVSCSRRAVRVAAPGPADEVLEEAVDLLTEAVGHRCDEAPQLTITLGRIGDLEAVPDERLAGARHPGQAYAITSPSEGEIVIAGGSSVGALYGAVTLAQLLDASAGADPVEVPLAEIADWPEIEERGVWNYPDAPSWVPWMAGLKLNYGKMAGTSLGQVERGRPVSAEIDADLMVRARRRGFAYVPFISHLNFLHDSGIFRAYPELAGKGDAALAGRYFAHKQGNQHRAPCASQPVLVDLLAEWMLSIAEQGAGEISCWLSERPCQCQCERCTPVGQFVLETRAFVAAWQRARQRFPGLVIRIFSSTTTPEQDDRVLAELPEEVRFERACATAMERWRNLPRDRFANPCLDAAAAAGRWIASYDVPLQAYGNVDTPEFKVPQFSPQRVRDFVAQLARRGYAGAYGMMAWSTMTRETSGLCVCALAEYAWNPQGRSARELGEAWATREGLSDPAAVGAWVELTGEVEFDVYDSDFPMCWSWGRAAAMVEEGQAPRFGDGMFRHFADEDDFERKLETCRKAAELVEGLERGDLALATEVVRSYVALIRSVWRIAHEMAHADRTSEAGQRGLMKGVEELEEAGEANVEAIRAWRSHLGPEPWNQRVHDAMAGTRDTVRRIAGHVRDRYIY